MNEAMKQKIENGEVFLGIELGSTRIKAVLIDNTYAPIASGGYNWENRLRTAIGLITWTTFGPVCRPASGSWRRMSAKGTVRR